jgi:hypothetical protein
MLTRPGLPAREAAIALIWGGVLERSFWQKPPGIWHMFTLQQGAIYMGSPKSIIDGKKGAEALFTAY